MSDDEHMHRQSLFCHTVASLGPSLFECPTRADMTASFGTASCFATPVAGSDVQKYEKPAASGLFHVLQICCSKGREPCWISLEVIIPSPELLGGNTIRLCQLMGCAPETVVGRWSARAAS